MFITARAFLVFEITGSAAALGGIYFASYSPQLLLSLFGGMLADRYDRRRLVLGSTATQALGALAIGALAAMGSASFANLALLSFLMGVGDVLAAPAQQALLPSLVPREQLHSAVALGTATSSMTRVAGPLAAGVLIPVIGAAWVCWINAASFLGVIVVWWVIRLPRQPEVAEAGHLEAIAAGLRFARTTPVIAVPVVAIAFLSTVGLVYQPLAVAYATDVLAGGDGELGATRFGALQAALGLGAAVGILGLAGLGHRHPRATFVSTALGFSAALVGLGLTTSYPLALASAFAIGALHFANATIALNLVQHAAPEALRGRLVSIQHLAWIGSVPLAGLVGGGIAESVGTQSTFVICGSLCVAFSLALARLSRPLAEPIRGHTPA